MAGPDKKMQSIEFLTKEILKDIRLIVFDVDGVLVPRGTNIKQKGNITTFETKCIAEKQIEQIKKLNERGFLININSGRGLYMLQEMFRKILPFTSLTYENGSATWLDGKIYQHVNSFAYLKEIIFEIQKIKHKNIKGFEPKEFIISVHCTKRVKKIENILARYEKLYCIWNSEAYDIGVKNIQTKAVGLNALAKLLKLNKKDILVIGDNYNDKEMIGAGGISISADKTRVGGDFFVNLDGKTLPADQLMEQILNVSSKK